MEQPFLTSPEIRQLVGEGAFERGRAYARSGMVRQVRWNPAGRLLTAIVDGSGPRPYRSQVAFSATKAVWASSCSCPMGLDCKHIAALLLVASAPDNDPVTVTAAATTSATRTPEAARSWRTLVPATPDRGAALALGVELRRRERRTAARWSSAEARSVTRSAVSIAFGDLHVGLRPLVQSATTRRWIKGNISWEAVRQQRGGFRRDHLKWLRDLQAIAASSRPTWSPLDSAEWIVLDTIESPLLWRHLREAAGLKIPLVALSSSVDVRIVDNAGGALPGLGLPAAQAFVAALGVEVTGKQGWTDVARFSAMGIPAVNYGPGDPNLAHMDDEQCPVAQYATCEQALLRWLS